jgi:hypothetical protein
LPISIIIWLVLAIGFLVNAFCHAERKILAFSNFGSVLKQAVVSLRL